MSKEDDKKKLEEREFLEDFIRFSSEIDLQNIRGDENPDFLCTFGNGEIGIELTRFFFPITGGQSPQAAHKFRQGMMRDLTVEQNQRGLPPLHVSVHLSSDENLFSKNKREVLRQSLVDFVSEHVPDFGPHSDYDFNNLPTKLADLKVGRIMILRSPAITKTFWSLAHASFLPNSDSSLVQQIVKEKSAKIPVYKKKAKILWLLIVSGRGGLNSIIDFDGDVLTASYLSDFDRIFLLRTPSSSVHELKVVKGF